VTRALALALVAVLSSGCACAVPAAFTGLGLAATLVTHDPGHVVQPAIHLVACVLCPPHRDP